MQMTAASLLVRLSVDNDETALDRSLGPTGKPDIWKQVRPVWGGGKAARPYLSLQEFMEAGRARLAGNTKRQASSSEVDELRQENEQLKQLVAELALKNRVLKKSVTGLASEWGE
jgi:hypothetical protein